MIEVNHIGRWDVNGIPFYNKREAVLYASANGCPDIKFVWHDDAFVNFDRRLLGTKTLPELYKERAQQVRDEYDYIIFNYSGGPDSHNMLRTFIENKIKIDQIYVRWPVITSKAGLYVPNTTDLNVGNTVSEWDFSLKPTLDWLAKNHPEIPIEIYDWGENLHEGMYHDAIFEAQSHYYGPGSLASQAGGYKRWGYRELEKGKKVCSLMGFDKPRIGRNEQGQVGMFFSDLPMCIASDVIGEFEPFYWSHKLPHLPFEQAYRMYTYFKHHPEEQDQMWMTGNANWGRFEHNKALAVQICYSHTWDPAMHYQGGKDISPIRRERDQWLWKQPQFSRLLEKWDWYYRNVADGMNEKYYLLWDDIDGRKTFKFREIVSRAHYLGNL
jgi:hypothetical protein